MKYLKSFNENISIYDPKWEVFLPKTIVVLKGQDYGIDKLTYKKGNEEKTLHFVIDHGMGGLSKMIQQIVQSQSK